MEEKCYNSEGFLLLFFLPPCSFGSIKTKSVTLNYQAREAIFPFLTISAPHVCTELLCHCLSWERYDCFALATASGCCTSLQTLHHLFAAGNTCYSWERICTSICQLWRWTMVIYCILTARLRNSHTSWLEKQQASPSPQTFQGNFKADLQAGTHRLEAPDVTFHCTTVKYQNHFMVWEEFSELSE